MNRFEFTAFADDSGQRLDKWLIEKDIDVTRSALQKLIADGGVSVNNAAQNKTISSEPETLLKLLSLSQKNLKLCRRISR